MIGAVGRVFVDDGMGVRYLSVLLSAAPKTGRAFFNRSDL